MVKELLQHIYRVKSNAAALAKYYVDGKYSVIVNYVKNVWGSVPTFELENDAVSLDAGARELVLAANIAENLVLYSKYRKMKNVITTIVGIGGSGKTTYAIASCIGAYMMYGYTYEEALALTSQSIFFDLESFLNALKQLINNNVWTPCIIADDVGEWLTKYWRDVRLMGAIHFFNLLDQAKDWTGHLIFTARSFEGSIAANIRQKSDIIVDASEQILDYHRLSVFEFYLKKDYSEKDTSAKKKRMLYLDAIPATLKMPDTIWDTMMSIRRKHAGKSIEMLEKLIEALPKLQEKYLKRLEEKLSEETNKT